MTAIKYQVEPPIGTIILDQPEADNRIDPRMAEELRQACNWLGAEEGVNLVVLTGSGDCFSRGREPVPPGLSFPEQESWLARVRVASAVAALPMPVLVALNGDTLDHGLELALAGDLRVAASGAGLGLTDLARPGNCFPWDGGTQRLPRLIGPAWASDLLLTARVVAADEALTLGLVNRVVPAEDLAREVERLAESILRGGPVAARYAKEAVRQGRDLPLRQALGLEADLNVILQSTEDRAEGLRSFAERRSPRFSGR